MGFGVSGLREHLGTLNHAPAARNLTLTLTPDPESDPDLEPDPVHDPDLDPDPNPHEKCQGSERKREREGKVVGGQEIEVEGWRLEEVEAHGREGKVTQTAHEGS